MDTLFFSTLPVKDLLVLRFMDFKNLRELFIKFSNEEICREYLAEQRWHGKPVCPYCSHSEKIYRVEKGKRYKCSSCVRKFSVTVGTVFEDSKIPLSTWFGAIYLATAHKKGISSLQLHRDLGVTQKTAWFMLHRIREMLRITAPETLSNTIEIDETYIGGKDKNKHLKKRSWFKRKLEAPRLGYPAKGKSPVLGILERGGRVHVQKMEHAGKQVLAVIDQTVSLTSTLITDSWGPYLKLSEKYEHFIVDHSADQYARGNIHTNTIEGFWSLLKRGIVGIYHYVSYKHLNKYCGEFAYRYNTRHLSDPDRFIGSLPLSQGKRIKYKELTHKSNLAG